MLSLYYYIIRIAVIHLNNLHDAYGKCDYLYERPIFHIGDQ